MKTLWKKAGVHCYSESGDVLYGGRNWLCLYTVEGGKKTIQLPFSANVINPLTGEQLAKDSNSFEVVRPAKSTAIYRITSFK